MRDVFCHTHHKCASRWLLAYFEEVAKINSFSFHHTDYSDEVQRTGATVSLFGNSVYHRAAQADLSGFHIIRNPASVLLSGYHSHLRTHGEDGWPELSLQRSALRAVDDEAGLYLSLAFMERWDMNARAPGPLAAMRTWRYDDPRFKTIRVEDLVKTPDKYARGIFGHDAILPENEQFAFKIFAQEREVGQIDISSHYRSGDPDEWKHVLPTPIIEYLKRHYEDVLASYYPDVLAA
ncbi:hypothetical protein UCD39_12295 [Nitrospirillum sp. BR 11752]|uniref:hypothetical protein n=1 Tax=Nitrospirillum sp. BR 11752 TaxID=3104293 RepID=UPI002EAF35A8|nr:hypothetical protein [Nitrospirillum sp. BR 11752]